MRLSHVSRINISLITHAQLALTARLPLGPPNVSVRAYGRVKLVIFVLLVITFLALIASFAVSMAKVKTRTVLVAHAIPVSLAPDVPHVLRIIRPKGHVMSCAREVAACFLMDPALVRLVLAGASAAPARSASLGRSATAAPPALAGTAAQPSAAIMVR